MDATQIVLLTSIVNIILNGIVVGIVIFVIQKKIDAAIQKSLVEYQTTFAANYTKRVETLQTLYQKMALYSERFAYMTMQVSFYCNSNLEQINITHVEYDAIGKELDDFWEYFQANKIFLSDNLAEKIHRIHRWSTYLYEEIEAVLPYKLFDRYRELKSMGMVDEYDPFKRLAGELSSHPDVFTSDISLEDYEGLEYGYVLRTMDHFMYEKVRELAELYKSVAELKS